MQSRFGSPTLSQLAFPREGNPNFPWKKSHSDNTVKKEEENNMISDTKCAIWFNEWLNGMQSVPLIFDWIVRKAWQCGIWYKIHYLVERMSESFAKHSIYLLSWKVLVSENASFYWWKVDFTQVAWPKRLGIQISGSCLRAQTACTPKDQMAVLGDSQGWSVAADLWWS